MIDNHLDAAYWDKRWKSGQTGWDIGYPSPALVDWMKYFAKYNSRILIPGCGNAYEAEALAELGYLDIHLVDISQTAVEVINQRCRNFEAIRCDCIDFFELSGTYDLILEQTFFCAIEPKWRRDYVRKCSELLEDSGLLTGVLFSSQFDKPGPPFGGTQSEYQSLFQDTFDIVKMEDCYNSIPPRAGNELFICLKKKS